MATLTNSYWPADESQPVREVTVGDVLREAAAQFGPAIALVEGTPGPAPLRRRWSFAQLLTQAEQVAAALSARFEPNERVAVWAPNIPEWVLLEFAAALAGITLVTVNPALTPREVDYVLRQSGAVGVFVVPQWRGNPMAESIDQIRAGLGELREVVLFSEWPDLIASSAQSGTLPQVRPSDAAQIQYTSGTTGFPKGAVLHHRGLANNAAIFATIAALGPTDVVVNPMPMFHTVGCVLTTLGAFQSGACQVLHSFDPRLTLELIETEEATVTLGAPTMLTALLEHPDLATRNTSSLRLVLAGGAPVSDALVRSVESTLHVTLTTQYGMTECSPLVTQVRPDDHLPDRTGTVGRPVPQTEVKIADPSTDDPVPIGVIGEVCVRGYNVMTGYHAMPAATAATIDEDGWYHTGDLASMDARATSRSRAASKT